MRSESQDETNIRRKFIKALGMLGQEIQGKEKRVSEEGVKNLKEGQSKRKREK